MPIFLLLRRVAHRLSLLSLDCATRRAIFDCMDASDLANLSQVCYALDAEVARYWAHVLVTMCARYVDHPSKLLSTMRIHRGVFSGSAVLAALSRARWRPGDFDIYCPAESFHALVYHFALVEGYQLENADVVAEDDSIGRRLLPSAVARGYGGAPHIQRVAHMRRGEQEVDIVQSASTSALEPVAAFWTTAVQNFMAPSVFCVAYSALTESKTGLLAPSHLVDMQHPPPSILAFVRKYEARGFRFAVRPYTLNGLRTCNGHASADCPSAVRFFGDRHCTLLKTQTVEERMRNDDWLELFRRRNVMWWRGGYVCGQDCGMVGLRVWPGVMTVFGDETGNDE